MNIIKKIFAAVTAAASAGVLAFASVTASAAGDLDPSETAPYTIRMAVQARNDVQWDETEENTVKISADGTYTTSYTFKMGSTTIEALVLDTSINAASFAPEGSADPIKDCTVKISVDKIEMIKKDGTTSIITYMGPSDNAFCLGPNGKCCRLNIINIFDTSNPIPIKDIYETLPDTGAVVGDKLSLTFTVSGLGGTPAGTTTSTTGTDDGSTTTTTTTTVYNGNTFNSGNKGGNVTYSTTSTVTQTADAGVIAIVVSATAAAALAAGAMTIRRKKK